MSELKKIEMKNVTDKYVNMIEAFECDFSIYEIENCQENEMIVFKFPNTPRLLKDIDLLKELSFNLRHNKAEIHEKGANNDKG